ncbi:hypothetical protein [Roseiterribacter gracilis]|uniref:Uncharacterized protein n=1 Tax=Roseiterribacter gracilis TaxID=2812848 RepID=A0A8S8XDF2_9PROT|nr:hypothetical protein TMPK1_15330 [Rhodospirillales bacterium TMPK1]
MARPVRLLIVVTAALWIAFWVLRQWLLGTTEPFPGSVPYLDDDVAYQVTRDQWNLLVVTSIAGAIAGVVTLLAWIVSALTRRKRRFRKR